MKLSLKLLVQVLLLILLTPSFLLGFLIGIVVHPVQAGFLNFKPFAEYILNLRKERE